MSEHTYTHELTGKNFTAYLPAHSLQSIEAVPAGGSPKMGYVDEVIGTTNEASHCCIWRVGESVIVAYVRNYKSGVTEFTVTRAMQVTAGKGKLVIDLV